MEEAKKIVEETITPRELKRQILNIFKMTNCMAEPFLTIIGNKHDANIRMVKIFALGIQKKLLDEEKIKVSVYDIIEVFWQFFHSLENKCADTYPRIIQTMISETKSKVYKPGLYAQLLKLIEEDI